MNKVLEIIIDVIIAILIMFAAVTIYFGLRMETTVKTIVVNDTDNFISNIKKKGYFTPDDYEAFYNKLSLTHAIYDISFEHTYKIWEPEYRMRTLQEILDAQNASFTGKNVYTYREVKTEVPTVTDPVNAGSLNTETNESVLTAAVNTPADPSHVHNISCYGGGDDSLVPDVYFANYGTSPMEWGPGNRIGTHYWLYMYCSHCGNMIGGLLFDDYDQWDNAESYNWTSDFVTIWQYYKDNSGNLQQTQKTYSKWETRWEKEYTGTTDEWPYCYYSDGYYAYRRVNPDWGNILSITTGNNQSAMSGNYAAWKKLGLQESYICPCCSYKLALLCNQIVSGITPTNPTQVVATGDHLITTVKSTYLDGSTKVVVASTDFSTNSIVNNQTVQLTYNYAIAGKTYSKTCNITVSVVPRTKTCINGHTYNLNSDGSDPGCPYCKAWVKSLQFINPTTTSMTITIGTTLQDNGVKVLATYMDGHTETLTNEFADNLDTNYLGTMMVTVGYKGVTAQLRVTTVCKKMACPICGNTYNLYPDGTDPGCPYCISKVPVFTGNVDSYEESLFTEDILNTLYKDRIYELNQNDIFTVSIRNKSTNIARNILRKLYPAISNEWMNLKRTTKVYSNEADTK